MKTRILIPLVFSFASIFLFAGCFGVDGNFSEIRNEIISASGENFHTDVELAVGSLGLGLAKTIVSMSDDNEDAEQILRHISKVQVGVYKNHHRIMPEGKIELIDRIDETLNNHGWKYIVKNYSSKELSIIYVKKDSGYRLNKMFVVNLNKKELSIVEVSGDLDKVISEIIREKGFGDTYVYNN